MESKFDRFLELLFNSNATLFAGAALIFGAIRIILVPSERSFHKFLTTFFICIPFGTIAGGVAYEQFGGIWVAVAVASTASFLAEKLLMALYNGEYWPLFKQFFERIIDNLPWTKGS